MDGRGQKHPPTVAPSDVDGSSVEAVLTGTHVLLTSVDTPHGAPIIVGGYTTYADGPYWAQVVREWTGGGAMFRTAREALDFMTEECARLLGVA